jgi:hypothetical protein
MPNFGLAHRRLVEGEGFDKEERVLRVETGLSPQVRDLMIKSVEADIYATIKASFSLQCRKAAWSASRPNSIRHFADPAHPCCSESEQEKHFNFLGSSTQLYRVMGLEFSNELFCIHLIFTLRRLNKIAANQTSATDFSGGGF